MIEIQSLTDVAYVLHGSDNVYSIMAVFGLALAYRRVDDDAGRECKST